MASLSLSLLATVTLTGVALARPHHGGPHYEGDSSFFNPQQTPVMKRMGPSSASHWPSSSSHWADVPSSFGESNKNWKQWGSSAPIVGGHHQSQPEQAQGVFSYHEGVGDEEGLIEDFETHSDAQPFKRHVDNRHFGPPASVNSFSPNEFNPSTFSVPSNNDNSFRSQGPSSYVTPASAQYPSYPSSPSSFEGHQSESYEEVRSPQASGGGSSSFQGFQRPAGFANVFPQSFESFKENIGKQATFSPPQQPSFHSSPSGSSFVEGNDESDFVIDESEFIDEEPVDFKNGYPADIHYQSGPSGDGVRIRQEFGSHQSFDSPPSGYNRPERAPAQEVSYVSHEPSTHSYPSYGARPSAPQPRPPQQNVYYRSKPSGPPSSHQSGRVSSNNQFDEIKNLGDDLIDAQYEEFNDEYERHNRGATTDDKYQLKKNGDKKFKYKMVDYRKPIQRVYDKEPEHEENDYGTNYGALEIYSGGYESDKYDPEQYARDEENNPDPGEMYDAMEEEHPQMQAYERQRGGPKLRRQGQQQQQEVEEVDDFDVEERDPDDNEEGYYVPVEAREAPEENEEEQGRGQGQDRGQARNMPNANAYRLQNGRYQEVSAKQQRPSSRKAKVVPYYGTDEVEKELDHKKAGFQRSWQQPSQGQPQQQPEYRRY